MFKKIVSNLPFSPALVGQLGFYAKRLKGEEITRRLGLVFVALALVIQSLAVFQPPTSANASSEADMILGGAKSLKEVLAAYDNNTRNFKSIMNRVGITRLELSKAQYGSFKVENKLNWALEPLYSYEQGEREFSIYNDSSQIIDKAYSRPLKLGTNCTSCTRTGWISTSEKLGWFAIRDSCGNLISNNNPSTPTKCQYNQSILATDAECKPCEYNASIWYKSILCIKPITIEPLKCIYNSSILLTDKDCKPCEYNLSIWYKNPLCKKPVVTETAKCVYNTELLYDDDDCKPCEYDSSIWYKDPSCKEEVIIVENIKCAINPNLLADDPDCVSCPGNESIWINDESCSPNIIKSKTASNITQGDIGASSTKAKARDKISYTITIKNIGTLSASDIEIEENLSDVIEYSTISDYGGGEYDSSSHILSWPNINLLVGEEQTRKFSITMLEAIPATAQGSSNDFSYDCVMTNTFGNSVDIPVDCPTQKIVEQIATSLPVTGPKNNMLFAGITLAIVAYFYARSRQQSKEIRLIRKDINMGTI